VAAELGERPMGLTCKRRIVHKRKDDFGYDVGFELSASTTSGTVDEPVDTEFVETRDPEAESSFAHPAVAESDLIGCPNMKKMNGV